MSDPQQVLFEAVRKACKPGTWSRGVELNRAGAVVAEVVEPDEVVFHISSRGGMISRAVTLFPEDGEWECACREDACEHAAAAVIAWRRAGEEGGELRSPKTAGKVEYRFTRFDGALALERFIVKDGEAHRLEATLAAVASGKVAGPRFVATQADLAVELALGTHRRGVLPRPLLGKLLPRLSLCSSVLLDGRPVKVSAEPVQPRVVLEDHGDDFRLFLEEDRSVDEAFSNGLSLCGEMLRPVREAPLTGRELDQLPRGRVYSSAELADLVTDVLPSLRKRVSVDIRTDRLPETVSEPPRVQLDLEPLEQGFSVLPTIVYGDPPTARVDAGRLVHLQGRLPLRDEQAEKRWVRRLQRELHLVPGVRAHFVGEDAVGFTSRLDAWKKDVRGRAHQRFRLAPPIVPRMQIDGGELQLDFESYEQGSGGARGKLRGRAEPKAVIRAWREGASLVPLMDGGWAPLPADWLERFGNQVADLLAARDEQGALPRCVLPDLARLAEELNQPPPPEFEGLRQLLDGFDGISETEPLEDLTVELRSYQQRGVDWLVFLREAGLGGLLADDMGLGKTLQALCAVRGRTLVVCPTSVLHNWGDEIRRHRPALGHAVYHGPKRELDPAADVTLTTYAILRLDAEQLAAVSWDTVILDEAQAIKNPESQVAVAAYGLQAGFKLTLTGTPVENRLDELWSQFHFINRGLLGGRDNFHERYATPIADGEPGAAKRLRERIRPFLLRRLKQDVAPELPPRTEVVLRCQLSEEERNVYDTIRAASLSKVVEQLRAGGGVMAALEALLRLRQASCHTSLVPGHEAAGSSKLSLLLESLDSVVAEGHKALVFSQWTSLLDLAEPYLEQAGLGFTRLDGSTRDRAAVVRGFQQEGGPPVMLISLKAGGTGLNLTAADHVFLLDLWWNPAVEAQAADRAHRIGQLRPVMVYRLVAEDTVEERILELQSRKRELADAALGEADQAAGLSREDLLDLLS